MTSGTTLQQAIELGKRAVLLDKEGKHEGAAYYYEQAAVALEGIVATTSEAPITWTAKATEYKQRAASLRNSCKLFMHILLVSFDCWITFQISFLQDQIFFLLRFVILCRALTDRGTAINFKQCS
jgi:hypothetical protein